MKMEVVTYNAIEGFHAYKDAPEFCSYLRDRHRHIFVIRCKFCVSHNDRQIEINRQQRLIETALTANYGNPCEFGNLSCEDIAQWILGKFESENITAAEVLEDGYGGASLTR